MRRVLVIDDHAPSRVLLGKILRECGYEIAGEGTSGKAALALARSTAPDVVLIAVGLADFDGIDAGETILDSLRLPVVLITSHYQAQTIERANRAGIMAILLKPVRREAVAPAIEMALARFQDFIALQQENQSLKETLEARKLIERAKGLLMQQRGLSEAQAYSLLKKSSMNMRKPMANVAQAIVTAGDLASASKSK